MNSSTTKSLQHSVLQLFNERIAYTEKLQIIGVICVTADGCDDKEIVIKLNNTLKRVTEDGGGGGGEQGYLVKGEIDVDASDSHGDDGIQRSGSSRRKSRVQYRVPPQHNDFTSDNEEEDSSTPASLMRPCSSPEEAENQPLPDSTPNGHADLSTNIADFQSLIGWPPINLPNPITPKPEGTEKKKGIESDYLIDKLQGSVGDGRRRRRRLPDDQLTAEEIAEYMGLTTTNPNAGNGPFRCKFCSTEAQDLTKYLSHTLSVHHAYICHECGKNFTTKSSLLRHRPIHTGMRRYSCSICSKTFYRKDKCKAHIKRHLGFEGPATTMEHSVA